MATAPRRSPRTLIAGAIVLVLLAWGIWAWTQWGKPGQGVDDSPDSTVQPATIPQADVGAQPAQPDNSGRDATGDASAGDRTVTRNPA